MRTSDVRQLTSFTTQTQAHPTSLALSFASARALSLAIAFPLPRFSLSSFELMTEVVAQTLNPKP